MLNPYEVLNVPRNASIADIKSAYRRLAKETHPDRHGGSYEHAARFREITEAYAILNDPEQRARYDQHNTVNESQVAAATEEVLRAVAYVRQQAAMARGAATRAAVVGTFWLVLGLVVSIGTYAAASQEGGRYFIMWGAVVFGGIQAVRGFIAQARINAEAARLEQELWTYITNA